MQGDRPSRSARPTRAVRLPLAVRLRRLQRRFVSDRQAQMMLLTAFVLVIGFVALAGMVARLNQLPEATRQAGDRPIYTEAAAVSRGVEASLERINELMAPVDADDLETKDIQDVAEQALMHMERLESAQGFRLQIDSVDCVAAQDTTLGYDVVTITVDYALADTRTRIAFSTSWVVLDMDDVDANGDHPPLDVSEVGGVSKHPSWCTTT